jgi:hypothetical protein
MAHLTQEELKGYETRKLAASALVAADRHLAECSACRYELRRTASAAPALPSFVMEMAEPVHLTFEEMSDYVDAKIDDAGRERMDEHTSICRSCAKELRDLQAFDARMALGMKTVPAAAVAAGPSWLTRVTGNVAQFFGTPARLQFAGVGIGLMLLGVFSLLHVQMKEGAAQSGSGLMAQVTLLSASTHPGIFYGGFLIAGVGLIALVYGLFKK